MKEVGGGEVEEHKKMWGKIVWRAKKWFKGYSVLQIYNSK